MQNLDDQEEYEIDTKRFAVLKILMVLDELKEEHGWTLNNFLAVAKSILVTHCIQEKVSLHEFSDIMKSVVADYKMILECEHE